jgi:actin-related protein
MAIDSINSCDIDVRKDLLNNVLLVGGNTLIPGLDDLFNRKFTEVAP